MKAPCLPVFLCLLTSLADDKGSDIDITILPNIVVFILLTAYISLLPSQVYLDSCLYRCILYISSVFPSTFVLVPSLPLCGWGSIWQKGTWQPQSVPMPLSFLMVAW